MYVVATNPIESGGAIERRLLDVDRGGPVERGDCRSR